MAILHLLLTVQFIRTVFFEYNQPVAPGKLDIPPISFQGRFDAKSQPLSHESPDSPVSDHTNSSRRCREPLRLAISSEPSVSLRHSRRSIGLHETT